MDWVGTRDRLHASVLDAFNEHGVQIMSPGYEGDPESPKIVPGIAGSRSRPPRFRPSLLHASDQIAWHGCSIV